MEEMGLGRGCDLGKRCVSKEKIGLKKMCLQGWRRRGRGEDIPQGEDKPKKMMRLSEEMGPGKG